MQFSPTARLKTDRRRTFAPRWSPRWQRENGTGETGMRGQDGFYLPPQHLNGSFWCKSQRTNASIKAQKPTAGRNRWRTVCLKFYLPSFVSALNDPTKGIRTIYSQNSLANYKTTEVIFVKRISATTRVQAWDAYFRSTPTGNFTGFKIKSWLSTHPRVSSATALQPRHAFPLHTQSPISVWFLSCCLAISTCTEYKSINSHVGRPTDQTSLSPHWRSHTDVQVCGCAWCVCLSNATMYCPSLEPNSL